MDQLLVAILVWVSANTGYSTEGIAPPRVVIVSQDVLCAKMYSPDGVATPTKETFMRCEKEGLSGVYREDDETIYLPQSFEQSDGVLVSRLAHETFHFVQGKHGVYDRLRKGEACRGQIELEAYRVEELWRMQHQVIPVRVVNSEQKFLMANCKYSIF